MTERKPGFMVSLGHPIAGKLDVDPSIDVIRRYDEEQYDHLQYLDIGSQKLTFLFLGSVALNVLAEHGVGEAFHDVVYDHVAGQYDEWQILEMEQEFGELT